MIKYAYDFEMARKRNKNRNEIELVVIEYQSFRAKVGHLIAKPRVQYFKESQIQMSSCDTDLFR